MELLIENIEPLVFKKDDKSTEEHEAVKVTMSSVMTYEEFSELKKKTKSWTFENGN